MANNNIKILSDLESEIMEIVWKMGNVSVRDALLEMKKKKKIASGISSSVILERINHLADVAYIPSFKHLGKSLIACAIVFAVVSITAFSVLSSGTKAYDMHSEGLCVLENNKKLDLIDALTSKQDTCTMEHVSHPDNGVCAAE